MPTMPIPRLATGRLLLRAPVAADFPTYARFLASPRAAGMGGPHGLRAAWGMFCHEVAGWALFGHGALMIDLRATGECVGQVGINHGPLFPEKELGWLVYEDHEGRGYATEAASALRDWAARALGLDRLVSYVDPQNGRSIAVAERLGAVLDPDAPKQDPGDLVYRHRSGRQQA
jgi:RimJ/RimL family protein N-acetyltransferase